MTSATPVVPSTKPALKSLISQLTKCPVCLERFTDPRSLPCLHTFCLNCIEGHCNKGGFSCPLCRTEFQRPSVGLTGLPRNFTVNQFLEAVDGAVYCGGSVHDKNELVVAKMFCLSCSVHICSMCWASLHHAHDCCDPGDAVKRLTSFITDCVRRVETTANALEKSMEAMTRGGRLVERFRQTETAIWNSADELKKTVDEHVRLLVAQIDAERSKVESTVRTAVSDALKEMRDFVRSARRAEPNMKLPELVARAADARAQCCRFVMKQKLLNDVESFDVKFCPGKVLAKNIVGEVQVSSSAGRGVKRPAEAVSEVKLAATPARAAAAGKQTAHPVVAMMMPSTPKIYHLEGSHHQQQTPCPKTTSSSSNSNSSSCGSRSNVKPPSGVTLALIIGNKSQRPSDPATHRHR